MRSEVPVSQFFLSSSSTRPRGWHENYYCENSFSLRLHFRQTFFFALVRLDFSTIVSGDAVWLELKQPAEETQKQQKDEKETRRQSRVMQKGWLWACVCAGRREKGQSPAEGKDNLGGDLESVEPSLLITSQILCGGDFETKKIHKHNQKSRNQPTREVLLAELSLANTCVCLCQAVKLRIPEKKKISSGRGLNAFSATRR